MRLAYAVNAHGMGHWTRSAAVMNALSAVRPDVEWTVSTSLPQRLVARDLRASYTYRHATYEPGTIQHNCFETDADETRRAYVEFLEQREYRLHHETAFLEEAAVDGVLVDAASVPVRAANRLGIPAFAVSNFTWDWIVEPMVADTPWARIHTALADDYGHGTRHLRLPLGPETSPFPQSEGAPMVARQARWSPAKTRRELGVSSGDPKLVLVCPGGWSAADWGEIAVSGCTGLQFVTVGSLPVRFEAPCIALSHDLPAGLSMPDLVAASDLVIAKPGYGIASECALHRTPWIAVERRGMRETEVLMDAMRRIGPTGEMTLEDFFAGRWGHPIEAILESRAAWAPIPPDGADQIATRLATLLTP